MYETHETSAFYLLCAVFSPKSKFNWKCVSLRLPIWLHFWLRFEAIFLICSVPRIHPEKKKIMSALWRRKSHPRALHECDAGRITTSRVDPYAVQMVGCGESKTIYIAVVSARAIDFLIWGVNADCSGRVARPLDSAVITRCYQRSGHSRYYVRLRKAATCRFFCLPFHPSMFFYA